MGARLDRLATESTRVLHDRRVPRSRANIDHLVVTPAGVWVIDSKRYQGRRPSLQVEGGLFRPRVEHLTVGGRKKPTLVAGVQRQLELVRATVSAPVFGALCFVDADWPLFGGSFTVNGIHVLWPRNLEALLRKSAGSTPVEATTQLLERRFMPA
ncbi:nuclease-related domain-containing protein [Curtobacterium sp. MCBA15_008]|uniref:nuclease-related domain-containing protein n=1 Tax=Curtobacterium sp. MCBA15_008 TaxID=1898736 RepID=UPI0020C85506|nr:nuclease-related domain-containing protein [Curtobacterium sp. MCBA15_008]